MLKLLSIYLNQVSLTLKQGIRSQSQLSQRCIQMCTAFHTFHDCLIKYFNSPCMQQSYYIVRGIFCLPFLHLTIKFMSQI